MRGYQPLGGGGGGGGGRGGGRGGGGRAEPGSYIPKLRYIPLFKGKLGSLGRGCEGIALLGKSQGPLNWLEGFCGMVHWFRAWGFLGSGFRV